jgi:hypothetical protein
MQIVWSHEEREKENEVCMNPKASEDKAIAINEEMRGIFCTEFYKYR